MLSIVVPAYNEGEHIYDNLTIIDKSVSRITSDYEIVAVNDGSKDNTGAEVARAASENPHIRDCGYEVNRGKGGAVTWGIKNSRGDIVGFLDADLDLNPDTAGVMYRKSFANFCVGGELRDGGNALPETPAAVRAEWQNPFARKVFSLCYYIMLKVLFGLKCHDTQTGIKLYRGDLIRKLAPLRKVDGFAFDIELLALANKCGAKLLEMPVELNFTRGESFILRKDQVQGCLEDVY